MILEPTTMNAGGSSKGGGFMLNAIYGLGRLFMSRGWIIGLSLIALTVVLGTQGFLATKWDNGSELSFTDALYKAVSLLAIQTGAVPAAKVWQLELASANRTIRACCWVPTCPSQPACSLYFSRNESAFVPPRPLIACCTL